jgi:hypothetical protein
MEQLQVRKHPIRLVNDDDLRRSHFTVSFRLLLAVPQVPWLERYPSLGDGPTA